MANSPSLTEASITSGTHISYWTDSLSPLFLSRLDENISADVVIVGAGIAGLSVAYNCIKNGLDVVIVEDGSIASGESGRTTAHLVNALDDRYTEIERIFGEDGARIAAESHTAAISFIERISLEENIDCDFKRVNGYLFLHPSDKTETLQKEFEATKRAGINTKWLNEVPFIKNEKKNCIEFPDQAQIHPLKYLQGLAYAIIKKGGRIFTETSAKDIDESGIVTANGFRVTAKHVVVATNSPINNKYVMHLKQFPYRTYVIGATITKDSVPPALWWDTGDFEMNKDVPPYHYVRTQPYNEHFDLLIVGGEDHPTGLPEAEETTETAAYPKLEGWTRARFDINAVVYKWSGQVLEPIDSLGFIGRNPMDKDNVYIVTGDSGNGMTHGTIAGQLITGLIVNGKHPWETIYRPSRTHFLKSGKTFMKSFFGGLIEYLKNSPKDTDIKLADIKPGQGKIVKMDNENFGAYRDENEDLHIVSATCTHLGCTIRWNEDEKTWDCPCHGSRFSYKGEVLNGPARSGLLYYKEEIHELGR